MDMQDVSNLVIPEGEVRTIYDEENRLLWGRLSYNIRYMGNAIQDGTPTPDSPVNVQVVTGEQTVTVSSKNLFNPDSPIISQISNVIVTKTALKNGVRLTATTVPSNANDYTGVVFIIGKVSDYIGKTISFSSTAIPSSSSKTRCYIGTCNSSGGSRSAKVVRGNVSGTYNYDLSWTVASDSNQYICIVLYEAFNSTIAVGDYVDFTDVQVEVGSTTTTYVPYQTPQSYTVNLGSIELCKLGTYQDYIYKSGGDWYVHKETGKATLNGSETWSAGWLKTYSIRKANYMPNLYIPPKSINLFVNSFVPTSSESSILLGNVYAGGSFLNFNYDDVGDDAGLPAFQTWLSSHNIIIYAPLTSTTDTQITDATLVGQLDAIHQFLTRYGYSATVSGSLPLIIDKTNL